MAETLDVVVCCILAAVVEFLEEEPVKEDDDIIEDFLPLFCGDLCFSERRKAVRIEGYAETVVPRYNLSEFRSHFRLSVETFEQLVVELGICPELPTGPQYGGRELIPVEKHLLITLWLLGNQESIRSVSDRFNVTKSSVFTCVNQVCRALKNNLTSQVIVWPTQEQAQVIMDGFQNHRGLPGVRGAIDGSHIPIRAPQECPENYINRKNFHSVNLTAICDHEMCFLDCYAGWPGSVHDSRVFKNSDLYQTVHNKFQDDSYLLGDSAYTLETWMMTLFKDHGNLTPQQRRFNFIHSSTRMVIERAFSLLKGRFCRLKYLDMLLIQDIPTVIIVACTLHNICLDNGDPYEDFMGEIEEEVNGFENVLPPGCGAEDKRNELMQLCC